MTSISEATRYKWERRLRLFWIVGGAFFIAGILVARPLTDSFDVMLWIIPFAITSLFSALAMSGVVWLLLQIARAQRARDQQVRSRPVIFR